MQEVYQSGAIHLITDFKYFEASFTKQFMLSVEMPLYEWMSRSLDQGPEWYQIVEKAMTGINKCCFKDFILWIIATRMSGEMCTSLGNGFSNKIVGLYFAHKFKWRSFKYAVEGDDGVFSFYGTPPTPSDYLELGLVIKLEVVSDLALSSFCGILCDTTDYVNITDPIRAMLKFCWTTRQYKDAKEKKLMRLLRAKALSMLHQYTNCPILDSLARYGERVTRRYVPKINSYMNNYERVKTMEAIKYINEHGLPPRREFINTRLAMERKFGITVEHQLILEDFMIKSWNLVRLITRWYLCTHPKMRFIMRVVILFRFYPVSVLSLEIIISMQTNQTVLLIFMQRRNDNRRKIPRKPKKNGKRQRSRSVSGMNLPSDAATKRVMQRRMQSKAVGSLVGEYAPMVYQAAKFISGFGDYKVRGNSLMAGNVPKIRNSTASNGGVKISHCEFLGDLTSTILFTLNSYPINPGMPQTFPWLSTLAINFEEYVIDGMIFELKSTSSNAVLSTNASGALGTMVVATRYDALDPVFVNKVQMLNYEFGNSSDPSKDLIHPIESAYNQTSISHRYIRSGAIPQNADLRLYDYGTTDIATVGMQANGGQIAEIWVSYQIRLFKPKLITQSQEIIERSAHYNLGTATVTNANPLGVGAVAYFDTIGLTIVGRTIQVPSPSTNLLYLGLYQVTGTSVATVTPAITYANGNGVNLFQAQTSPIFVGGGTGSTIHTAFCFTNTGSPTVVTFGAAGTIPTAPTAADLFIIELAPSFNLKEFTHQFTESELIRMIDRMRITPTPMIQLDDGSDMESSK